MQRADASQTRQFFVMFLGAPWLAIALCVVVGALWPQAASNLGGWILLFSGVAFGMPHGACDVWAMQQAVRRARPTSSTRSFDWRWFGWLGAYVGSAILMLLLWRANSAVALLVFLVVTMWHFGSADAWLHDLMRKTTCQNASAKTTATTVSRLALSWGRGLLVIAAPLTFQSGATQEILGRFIALSGAHDASALWKIAPWFLGFGLVLQGVGHILALRLPGEGTPTSSTRSQNRTLSAALWIETLGLLLLFAFAPPLLAVACYFLAVHAWRHMVRLEIFGGDDMQKNAIFSASTLEIARGVWRQHRGSFVLTIVALLGIVPILRLWPSLSDGGIGQWNTAYLVLISAVTVPHVTVVSWLEARHDL